MDKHFKNCSCEYCLGEVKTYKIIRFYHPSQDKDNRVIKKGLTLEQAQEHCQDNTTRKDGVYFDGYEAE